MKFNLPQSHAAEKTMFEVGKRIFFARGGTHDFSCASCHGSDDKRIRLQELPNLTRQPGAANRAPPTALARGLRTACRRASCGACSAA